MFQNTLFEMIFSPPSDDDEAGRFEVTSNQSLAETVERIFWRHRARWSVQPLRPTWRQRRRGITPFPSRAFYPAQSDTHNSARILGSPEPTTSMEACYLDVEIPKPNVGPVSSNPWTRHGDAGDLPVALPGNVEDVAREYGASFDSNRAHIDRGTNECAHSSLGTPPRTARIKPHAIRISACS